MVGWYSASEASHVYKVELIQPASEASHVYCAGAAASEASGAKRPCIAGEAGVYASPI